MPAYTSDSLDRGGRRQVVATVGMFVLSVVALLLPGARQQQIALALRVSVLRPFVAVQEGLALARARAADANVLRQQMDSLVIATSGYMMLESENRQLRGLLSLRQRLGPSWKPAGVVRSGTTGSESTFLLDIGSDDGVTRYSPVVAAEGVVGRVQEVYPKTSIAIDWTHPEFRASAMDPAGTTTGMALSRSGEFREADRLEFNGTAYTSRLEDGTPIVTTGLGGVFPPGIPIGKVDGLAEADNGWRKSYWLRPMVEVGAVTHVLVGTEPGSQQNLSAIWPTDSVFTGPEDAARNQARNDSLSALRTILSAPLPLRDSVLAALLLGSGWSPPPLTTPVATPNVGPTRGANSAGGQRGAGAAASAGAPAPRPAGPPVTTPPPRNAPPVTTPRPAAPDSGVRVVPDFRFPIPTDTVRIPARPDTLGGRGAGARPDTLGRGGGSRPDTLTRGREGRDALR